MHLVGLATEITYVVLNGFKLIQGTQKRDVCRNDSNGVLLSSPLLVSEKWNIHMEKYELVPQLERQ